MTSTDNNELSGDEPAAAQRLRRRKVVENTEYVAFCRRLIRAAGRRVEISDPESLALVTGLADEINAVVSSAARALHDDAKFSWTEIAAPLGITRQAARQRWGITSKQMRKAS